MNGNDVNDFVRNRIDAIVDQQETLKKAEPAKVEEIKGPIVTIRKKKSPKVLLVVLGVLVVGAIVVVLAIWKPWESRGGNEVEVVDKMDGWDGVITPSTQALIFSNDINEKMSSDPDYTLESALNDYQNIYSKSGGELKFYIAIKYAQFVYDQLGDLDLAVDILNGVKDVAESDGYLLSIYYSALLTLSEEAGNTEQVEYYKNMMSESIKQDLVEENEDE